MPFSMEAISERIVSAILFVKYADSCSICWKVESTFATADAAVGVAIGARHQYLSNYL